MMNYYLIAISSFIALNSITSQAPDWEVNAGAFQYNMSVIAEIDVDLETVHHEGNLIGAFVNEELRGVGSPITINDSVVYFLTVYSNVTSGENVSFQVYLQNADSILQALEILPFQPSQVFGAVDNPFTVNISILGDFPISLLPFANDTTLAGYAFSPIYVVDHLVQMDNDSITWAVISSEHLSATIVDNQFLMVSSNDVEWTGSELIYLIASETGNSQSFADSQNILLTVLPNFIGPVFDHIPIQVADQGGGFELSNLNTYIQHDSFCLNYEMEMIPLSGDALDPNWLPPAITGNSMNLILQMTYSDSLFNDTGILAGFVADQLAGTSEPVYAAGSAYYFLTLSQIAAGNISFQYYDSAKNYIYSIPSLLSFIPGGSIGTISNPEMIDLSPIHISLGSGGEIMAMLQDTSFEQIQQVQFKIEDCFFPFKRDSVVVLFTKDQCSVADIEICPGEAVCVRSPSDLVKTIWFKDDLPIWPDSIFSITEPGDYFFQGKTVGNAITISCLLTVLEGNGCSGDFPEINYPAIGVNFLESNGPVTIETYEMDEILFDITWAGNGDNISWHDPLNWDVAAVPCPCQNVIIPSGETVMITSNSSSKIWSLETHMNALLTLEFNTILKVIGFK